MVMTQFFDNLIINQCFILILITCVVPQISLINVSPMVIKKNNNWPTLVLTIWWIWKQKFPCLKWVVCWVLCLCCYFKSEDQPFFLSRKNCVKFHLSPKLCNDPNRKISGVFTKQGSNNKRTLLFALSLVIHITIFTICVTTAMILFSLDFVPNLNSFHLLQFIY